MEGGSCEGSQRREGSHALGHTSHLLFRRSCGYAAIAMQARSLRGTATVLPALSGNCSGPSLGDAHDPEVGVM